MRRLHRLLCTTPPTQPVVPLLYHTEAHHSNATLAAPVAAAPHLTAGLRPATAGTLHRHPHGRSSSVSHGAAGPGSESLPGSACGPLDPDPPAPPPPLPFPLPPAAPACSPPDPLAPPPCCCCCCPPPLLVLLLGPLLGPAAPASGRAAGAAGNIAGHLPAPPTPRAHPSPASEPAAPELALAPEPLPS